ncbi:MAG: hypothetical protein JJT77_02470 [Crocinitomicaceae bacterium]|nr:hypothetical protein [Crocinitomicaceae bacterium]
MLKNEVIQQSFNEQKFRESTIKQLKNEFLKVGLDLEISSEIVEKEVLLSILAQEIIVIQDQAPHLLAQLLYSFDLPENKVVEAFDVPQDAPHLLANAMLWRAAQKVYLKAKFRT